jgi:hypothetical protein
MDFQQYGFIHVSGTGSGDYMSNSRLVEMPFDKYIVKIRISSTNEILGIEEITINKDFLSHSQKLQALSQQGYHDVDEFYKDEEE